MAEALSTAAAAAARNSSGARIGSPSPAASATHSTVAAISTAARAVAPRLLPTSSTGSGAGRVTRLASVPCHNSWRRTRPACQIATPHRLIRPQPSTMRPADRSGSDRRASRATTVNAAGCTTPCTIRAGEVSVRAWNSAELIMIRARARPAARPVPARPVT